MIIVIILKRAAGVDSFVSKSGRCVQGLEPSRLRLLAFRSSLLCYFAIAPPDPRRQPIPCAFLHGELVWPEASPRYFQLNKYIFKKPASLDLFALLCIMKIYYRYLKLSFFTNNDTEFFAQHFNSGRGFYDSLSVGDQ